MAGDDERKVPESVDAVVAAEYVSATSAARSFTEAVPESLRSSLSPYMQRFLSPEYRKREEELLNYINKKSS